MDCAFDAFTHTCDDVLHTRSAAGKQARIAGYLQTLPDASLGIAARFFAGELVQSGSKSAHRIGSASIRAAVLELSEWDAAVFAWVLEVEGDVAATAGKLLPAREDDPSMTLERVAADIQAIAAGNGTHRAALLREILSLLSPRSARIALRILTGTLRLGTEQSDQEAALAIACDREVGAVHAAALRAGDLGAVALAARQNRLADLPLTPFHPLPFMRATTLRPQDPLPAGSWLAEDYLGGLRTQAHIAGGQVRLFSRDLSESSALFPEVLRELTGISGRWILDGVVIPTLGERPRHVNHLHRRLETGPPTTETLTDSPVRFVATDCLAAGGRLLVETPLVERRELLGELAAQFCLPRPHALPLPAGDQPESLIAGARGRGHAGVMLKQQHGYYECGHRTPAWLRLTPPTGSFLLVVIAIEPNPNRTDSALSGYTVAVRRGDGWRSVGRVSEGLPPPAAKELAALLSRLTVRRRGPIRLVQPRVVLEIACEGVLRCPRHEAGFTLRAPRILGWRPELGPLEITTLELLESEYLQSLR